MTTTNLSREISALFEAHGPAAILESLAQRLRDEAAIAHGEEADEGQPRLSARWGAMADDVQATADDCLAFGDEYGQGRHSEDDHDPGESVQAIADRDFKRMHPGEELEDLPDEV